ncbi:hypothetical protein [Chromohalobacter canadensis]|uniref:hypothetical protein n=1 Tax=Chromohalobacter canadensis TaxID=141389 RepID=UPI00240EA746|nr:hypothetical protein [Chromohalobacter canadensis]
MAGEFGNAKPSHPSAKVEPHHHELGLIDDFQVGALLSFTPHVITDHDLSGPGISHGGLRIRYYRRHRAACGEEAV